MISLWFSERALRDVDRFSDLLMESDPQRAEATLEVIVNAVEVLRRHPFIGRPIENGLRELVISRGDSGYVALYEFNTARNEITVHKLRHQLEAGYSD
jgi:plasmid stabilization system protein ParE